MKTEERNRRKTLLKTHIFWLSTPSRRKELLFGAKKNPKRFQEFQHWESGYGHNESLKKSLKT